MSSSPARARSTLRHHPVAARRLSHRIETARVDRRWLLACALVFVASMGAFAAAAILYRATGPHPYVSALVRRVKHEARWLIPGLKKKPNAKNWL